MLDKLFTKSAKDIETGKDHIFEVYRQYVKGKEPYVIMLDGVFHAATTCVPRVMREISRTSEWFRWQKPVVVSCVRSLS